MPLRASHIIRISITRRETRAALRHRCVSLAYPPLCAASEYQHQAAARLIANRRQAFGASRRCGSGAILSNRSR